MWWVFSHPVRLKKVLTRVISEAKVRAQYAALQEQYSSQHTMLNTLLDGTQEPIAYLHQGMHSYSNPAYRQLTGLDTEEEVLSTPLLDLVEQQQQPTLDDLLRQLEGGHRDKATLDCRMLGRHGQYTRVRLSFMQSWFDGESVLQLNVQAPPTEVDNGKPATTQVAGKPTTTPLACTPNLLVAARLKLVMEPINSLRADLFERHFVHIEHESGQRGHALDLLQDDQSGLTLIDLDRCVVLEAINQLAQRLRRNPNAQYLIPLQADAAQHLGLTQWLQQHLQTRSIPARAVTLMMPLTGGGNTFAEHFELVRQMQLAGVGVCIQGISGTTEEQLYLSTSDIDYAILTPQHDDASTHIPLDNKSFATIQKQVKICQRANVKTMMAARHPSDIATLWKLGVDCLIGDLDSQLDCALVY